jgi:hypothetical protein
MTLTGGVSHTAVPAYIDEMDIAVAPYPPLEKFYFSPLKVLEYMARGKAIVATSQGQIKDLIRHGETGWLVPAGDEASLVRAIRHLAENPGLRSRLGKKAAFEARTRHSWQHRVVSILEHIGAPDHPFPDRAKRQSLDEKNRPVVYTGLYQSLEKARNSAPAVDLGSNEMSIVPAKRTRNTTSFKAGS